MVAGPFGLIDTDKMLKGDIVNMVLSRDFIMDLGVDLVGNAFKDVVVTRMKTLLKGRG